MFEQGKSRGVERKGEERFNEFCLGVFFLSGRGNDLKELKGIKYPSNHIFLIPQI